MEREMKQKMDELSRANEEVKKAEDSATQSWLDSKPVIDKLAKLKQELEKSKNRTSEAETILSQLQEELESVHNRIRDMNEGGREANKIISETNQALDQIREDIEQLKEVTDEEKQTRGKLKQNIRVKRQELRKVQLTLRAVRMETEAYRGSEAEAVLYVNRLETENSTVQLSQEDYVALMKRVKEETSLGDWRVSISVEQRLLAEASREAAVKKFKEYYTEQISKNKLAKEIKGGAVQEDFVPEEESVLTLTEGDAVEIYRSRSTRGSRSNASSLRRNESNQRGKHEKARESGERRRVYKKKSTSIFYKIRRFFVLKIAIFFK